MAAQALVETQIDAATDREAAAVLAAMGLTVSDAVRLMLTRVARDLPFDPLVPNGTTIAAMDEARDGQSPRFETVEADLTGILTGLARDQPLAPRFRDHALTGNRADHRDCHIKPDLLLLYQRIDTTLVRLGSHGELGM